MKKITKAVFPVAGLGTRFLPATKASPKEMLPIVDKPLIQYAVEEAVAAGITELIFITGRSKRAIEDHFDKAYELENELALRNKHELLALVKGILPKTVSCIYIRQNEVLGLGHAVLCAKPVVGDDPFAVILADDLIHSEQGAISQMMDVFKDTQCSVMGVETVPHERTGNYGIVEVHTENNHSRVSSIVEKPHPDEAPSDLAVVGRYILTPQIFNKLMRVQPGAGGEIQLTDGIAALLQEEAVYALPFRGTRFDCGTKLGYLEATYHYAVRHPELGPEVRDYLKRVRTE